MNKIHKNQALHYLMKFQRLSKEEQEEEIHRLEIEESSKLIIRDGGK